MRNRRRFTPHVTEPLAVSVPYRSTQTADSGFVFGSDPKYEMICVSARLTAGSIFAQINQQTRTSMLRATPTGRARPGHAPERRVVQIAKCKNYRAAIPQISQGGRAEPWTTPRSASALCHNCGGRNAPIAERHLLDPAVDDVEAAVGARGERRIVGDDNNGSTAVGDFP